MKIYKPKFFAILCVIFLCITGTILIGCSVDKKSINTNASKPSPMGNDKVEESEPVIPVVPEVHKPLSRNFTEGKLKYNDKAVTILMYHSIDYEKGNDLRVPKEKFREQMKYLKDNNFTTLSLQEVYDFLENNKPIPEKSVAITLDDGYMDNYNNAFPVLKEFGQTAAIFAIIEAIDNDPHVITLAQAKEMEENGIDIESHCISHDHLEKMSYELQLDTLKKSKAFLEEKLNKEAYFIAYPYGTYNENTLKAAKEAGYKLGVTINSGMTHKKDGILTLRRVYVGAKYDMNTFINLVNRQ